MRGVAPEKSLQFSAFTHTYKARIEEEEEVVELSKGFFFFFLFFVQPHLTILFGFYQSNGMFFSFEKIKLLDIFSSDLARWQKVHPYSWHAMRGVYDFFFFFYLPHGRTCREKWRCFHLFSSSSSPFYGRRIHPFSSPPDTTRAEANNSGFFFSILVVAPDDLYFSIPSKKEFSSTVLPRPRSTYKLTTSQLLYRPNSIWASFSTKREG